MAKGTIKKVISIALIQAFLLSSSASADLLRLPLGVKAQRIKNAIQSPALRLSGAGLEPVAFNVMGVNLTVSPNDILGKVISDNLDTAKVSSLEEFLPSELSTEYRSAIQELILRIQSKSIDKKNAVFLFIPFLRKNFSGEVLKTMQVQLEQAGLSGESYDTASQEAAVIADALSSDIILHPGTSGDRKTAVIYADRNARWLLEGVEPELRARVIIHELLHLALRLERGVHPIEAEVQSQDDEIAKKYNLPLFKDMLEALNKARSDRADKILGRQERLITKRMAKAEENINALVAEGGRLKDENGAQVASVKGNLETAKAGIVTLQSDADKIGQEIKNLEGRIGSLKTKKEDASANHLTATVTQLDGIIKTLEQRLEIFKKQQISIQGSLEEARSRAEALQTRLNELNAEYEGKTAEIKKTITETETRLGKIQESADLLNEQRVFLTADLAPLGTGKIIAPEEIQDPELRGIAKRVPGKTDKELKILLALKELGVNDEELEYLSTRRAIMTVSVETIKARALALKEMAPDYFDALIKEFPDVVGYSKEKISGSLEVLKRIRKDNKIIPGELKDLCSYNADALNHLLDLVEQKRKQGINLTAEFESISDITRHYRALDRLAHEEGVARQRQWSLSERFTHGNTAGNLAGAKAVMSRLFNGLFVAEPAEEKGAHTDPVDALNKIVEGSQDDQYAAQITIEKLLTERTKLGPSVIKALTSFIRTRRGANNSLGIETLEDLRACKRCKLSDERLVEIRLALSYFPTEEVTPLPMPAVEAPVIQKEMATIEETRDLRMQARGVYKDYNGLARFTTYEEYIMLKGFGMGSDLHPVSRAGYSSINSVIERIKTRYSGWTQGTAVNLDNLPREARFLINWVLHNRLNDALIKQEGFDKFLRLAVDGAEVKPEIKRKFKDAVTEAKQNARIATLLITTDRKQRYLFAYDDIKRLLPPVVAVTEPALPEKPLAAIEEQPASTPLLEEKAAILPQYEKAQELLNRLADQRRALENIQSTLLKLIESKLGFEQIEKTGKLTPEQQIKKEDLLRRLGHLQAREKMRQKSKDDLIQEIADFISAHQDMANLFIEEPEFAGLAVALAPTAAESAIIGTIAPEIKGYKARQDSLEKGSIALATTDDSRYLLEGERDRLNTFIQSAGEGRIIAASELGVIQVIIHKARARKKLETKTIPGLEQRILQQNERGEIIVNEVAGVISSLDRWVEKVRERVLELVNAFSQEDKAMLCARVFPNLAEKDRERFKASIEEYASFPQAAFLLGLYNILIPADLADKDLKAEAEFATVLNRFRGDFAAVEDKVREAEEATDKQEFSGAEITYTNAFELVLALQDKIKGIDNHLVRTENQMEALLSLDTDCDTIIDKIGEGSDYATQQQLIKLRGTIQGVLVSLSREELIAGQSNPTLLLEKVVISVPGVDKKVALDLLPVETNIALATINTRNRTYKHEGGHDRLMADLATAIDTALDQHPNLASFGQRIKDDTGKLSNIFGSELFRKNKRTGIQTLLGKAREKLRGKGDEGVNGFIDAENLDRMTYAIAYAIQTDSNSNQLYNRLHEQDQVSYVGPKVVAARTDTQINADFIAQYEADLKLLFGGHTRVNNKIPTTRQINEAADNNMTKGRAAGHSSNKLVMNALRILIAGHQRYAGLMSQRPSLIDRVARPAAADNSI